MGNPDTADIDQLAQEWARGGNSAPEGTAVCIEPVSAMNEEEFEPERMLEEATGTPANEVREDLSLDTKKIIEEAIQKAAEGDCGAPFEELALHALLALKQRNLADWMRVRGRIKEANKGVSVVNLSKELSKLERELKPVAPTHNGYATDVLARLAVGEHKPVSVGGQLYVPKTHSQLWEIMSLGELQARITAAHDGKENCRREEDYYSIAKFAVALSECPDFFEKAPDGTACLRSFYRVNGREIRKEQLGLLHRQVSALPFEPADIPTPLYDQFLHQTFKTSREGEEQAQVRLVHEFAGAMMLCIAYRYQKAMVWTEPYGRAGKGTLQRILGNLVPEELTCAISPMQWGRGHESHVATLAGKRLNVVGELPENALIPAAEFKSILGLDAVTGRLLYGQPFSFENRAAHLFMSNHPIRTSEHSEAFYARWMMVEFPNSLLLSGKKVDPTLAERIIDSELPGIAFKALQGAVRLLQQECYSESKAHDRLLEGWRTSVNSLKEFIQEECDLGGNKLSVHRTAFYETYREWCKKNGRTAYASGRVRDMLSLDLKLGVKLAQLDGYGVYRCIRLKPKEKPSFNSNLEPEGKVEVAAVQFKVKGRSSSKEATANS